MDSFYWQSYEVRILGLAILQENLSVIKLVVESDARVLKEIPRGALGSKGRTCFHTAAYGTNPAVARFLLSIGADATVQDEYGRTPLHLAAAYCSLEVLRVIEAPNCNINARDCLSRTPLHWCLAFGGWKHRDDRAAETWKL
ncbi:ankyrin repeat-containing domain protein [Podospora didyma]|uniref:Ankyrin repeat-containing domain protein n=1 Tax=Podospora didyma TaxID=330526 RepID=A0AAE0N3Z9_9PEZI|nr:ankyrin repeat-containing domain protein [Podospora didyma]